MKANHVPREDRLRRRVNSLRAELGDMWEPIGRPNPYHRCRFCGKPQPACSYEGHLKGCRGVGIQAEIDHYESLAAGG